MQLFPCSTLVALALSLASSHASDPAAEPYRPAIARLQAHYAAVEAELLARDVSHLTDEQRRERLRSIADLRAYRERADFGQREGGGDARILQFVDADGRRCAVAELLHRTGQDALVESVRQASNEAWVLELAGDGAFQGWLDSRGLTLAEAIRIQGPAVPRAGFAGPADTVPEPSTPSTPYAGPSDSGGNRPGPSSPSPSGGSPTSASPEPRTPSSGSSIPEALSQSSDDVTWWMWWEYNKLQYLRATPLSVRAFDSTGVETPAERQAAFLAQLQALRKGYLPLLARSLEHADAQVRAEAAVAYARLGAGDAVDRLVAALSDASTLVRNRAILALGASGDDDAFDVLIDLARDGKLRAQQHSPSAVARPLAIVALGIGRNCGFGVDADREVLRLLQTRSGTDRDRIAAAALAYQILAPFEELEQRALQIAEDKRESTPVRARAIEALRSSSCPDVLARVQTLLSGNQLELRRSAAVALGEYDHELTLPALLTAFELEVEPLTRAFLLVSIGEQGGDEAQSFLADLLPKADGYLRPWAAIGLGLAARASGDARACDLLRAQAELERNQESIGAYWIALGLARDANSVAAIDSRMRTTSDPRQRMYLATALALVGDEAARTALLARQPRESSSMVQVAIAQALGNFGNRQDAAVLIRTLDGLREPQLQVLAAVSMGFHGTTESLSGLSALLSSPSTSSVTRAAAINGLGMMLGEQTPLKLARASQHANYTLFESWLDDVFQVTL